MTIEEYTKEFVQRVRFWLSEKAEEIDDLERRGMEESEKWEEIMRYVEECEWVLVSVYDPTYTILNEDDTAAFNFLYEWTDEELKQYLSDWEVRWGMADTPAVSLALESITLVDDAATGGSGGLSGVTLPPGDKSGDHLISTGNGQLGWDTPATVYDMGETT